MARLGLNAESGRPIRLARATIPSLLRLHRRGDLHIPRLSTVERGPAHRTCDEPPSRRVHPAVGWDRTSLHRAVAERQAVAAGLSGTLRLQRPMVSGSLRTRGSEPPITCAMWWLVSQCFVVHSNEKIFTPGPAHDLRVLTCLSSPATKRPPLGLLFVERRSHCWAPDCSRYEATPGLHVSLAKSPPLGFLALPCE